MIKSSIAKLEINFNPVEMAEKVGLQILDFTGNDALALKEIPYHHRAPFDHMLIAQAITRKLKLMSDDTKFKYFDCKII
jgi:PIN domain nuclease of toxin-antitoxin system